MARPTACACGPVAGEVHSQRVRTAGAAVGPCMRIGVLSQMPTVGTCDNTLERNTAALPAATDADAAADPSMRVDV